MRVKICGIKNKVAARQAVEAGADFIGFVFANSKRQITKEEAKDIAETVPDQVKKVGVFVNESKEVIEDIASTIGLDYVQLHGDESAAFCELLSYPVIKAFQINTEADFDRINEYACDFFLLDSPAGKYRGGNGASFDWRLTKHMPKVKNKVILAGGLHAENVRHAIAEVNPAAIDVSSGVETDGEKDLQKMINFITAAKQ